MSPGSVGFTVMLVMARGGSETMPAPMSCQFDPPLAVIQSLPSSEPV